MVKLFFSNLKQPKYIYFYIIPNKNEGQSIAIILHPYVFVSLHMFI